MVMAKPSRFDSAVTLKRDFAMATNVTVSVKTDMNRLRETDLHARKPAICVPLTPRHRVNRLAFARDHPHLRLPLNRHILFTDESKFVWILTMVADMSGDNITSVSGIVV